MRIVFKSGFVTYETYRIKIREVIEQIKFDICIKKIIK
jgi:hypothetical protein